MGDGAEPLVVQGIYDHPLYYDILFGWDRSREADFYHRMFERCGIGAGAAQDANPSGCQKPAAASRIDLLVCPPQLNGIAFTVLEEGRR
jgi:hypothetical protein